MSPKGCKTALRSRSGRTPLNPGLPEHTPKKRKTKAPVLSTDGQQLVPELGSGWEQAVDEGHSQSQESTNGSSTNEGVIDPRTQESSNAPIADTNDFEEGKANTDSGSLEPKKKKRKRNLNNKIEKNWTMAMKRHWDTPQKDKAMELITIKRPELHTVKPPPLTRPTTPATNSHIFVMGQAYHRLYLDGVVIVDDFFDDPAEVVEGRGEEYPKPLFKCTTTQTNWVCKAGVSRDIIFDSVSRSSVSAGYDTIHGTQDHKTRSKEVKGPVERQQLRCCKSNHEEMQKYHSQMDLILQSIFPPSQKQKKSNPKNWMSKISACTCRSRLGTGLRGRNNVSVCSHTCVWSQYLPNVASTKRISWEKRVRIFAHHEKDVTTLNERRLYTCRRHLVVSTLPREIFSASGSWPRKRTNYELLAAANLSMRH